MEHPIIIWGNGTGATVSQYDFALRHLASWGFVVAAANTGQSGSGREMLAGVDFLIAENGRPGSVFAGKLDVQHIGASGHSQGGGGAIAAAADPRIDAVVPVQPGPHGRVGSIRGPAFYIAGQNDFIVPSWFVQLRYSGTGQVPAIFGILRGADHFIAEPYRPALLGAVTPGSASGLRATNRPGASSSGRPRAAASAPTPHGPASSATAERWPSPAPADPDRRLPAVADEVGHDCSDTDRKSSCRDRIVAPMERPPARPAQKRKEDSLARLEGDVDLWVATADPASGRPYLTPLSFLWDGQTILISTPGSSVTSRNMQATGIAHLGVGLVRDVTLIEGTIEEVPAADVSAELGDAFAAKTGFDPRDEPEDYRYFRITPQRLRTWREANELTGRTLLRDGRWLVE